MKIRALQDSSQIGTGTLTVDSACVGGILITADGTNDCTVTLQRNDSSGKTIFKLVSKSPAMITAPIDMEGTKSLYFSVSGTGGAVQLFEWLS